jgi:hypothetical protein
MPAEGPATAGRPGATFKPEAEKQKQNFRRRRWDGGRGRGGGVRAQPC